jgi:hypothetical protein
MTHRSVPQLSEKFNQFMSDFRISPAKIREEESPEDPVMHDTSKTFDPIFVGKFDD